MYYPIEHVVFSLLLWAAFRFGMDCHMPGMDGYTTTESIRKLESERGTHVPIIAITAQVMQDDYERCKQAGMDDYLSKPVRFENLVDVLSRWSRSQPTTTS